MENVNDKQLSFPQRNWLLLCVIVAILSPLVVHWVHAGARHRLYTQETEIRDTGSKAASAAGNTDTSNKMASPATTQPAGSATAGKDSAK